MMRRRLRVVVRTAVLLGCLAGTGLAPAQSDEPPNGLLLIAKPSLADPNFAQTVVLVTQAPDASTVGVILNRPTTRDLAQFLAPGAPRHNYRDAIYFGGPVMPQVIVALFQSDSPPAAPAFHVHEGYYLSMDPSNVGSLLEDADARYRLYAGFAGWLPGQLSHELARDDWYLLPVEEEILFAKDTSRLWEELIARVAGTHARAKAGHPKTESPALAGLGSRTRRAVP